MVVTIEFKPIKMWCYSIYEVGNFRDNDKSEIKFILFLMLIN